jgi:hypothetical protein
MRPELSTHATLDGKAYKAYIADRKKMISKGSLSELAMALESACHDSNFAARVQLDILSVLDKETAMPPPPGQLSRILRTMGGNLKARDPNLLRIILLRLEETVKQDSSALNPKSLCLIAEGLSKLMKSSRSTSGNGDSLVVLFEAVIEAATSAASALTLNQVGNLSHSCAESRLLPSSAFFTIALMVARDQLSTLALDRSATQSHLASACDVLWAVALLNPNLNKKDVESLAGLIGIISSLCLSSDLVTPSLASRLVFSVGIISACHNQHQELSVNAETFTRLMCQCDPSSTNSASLVVHGLLSAAAATGHRANEDGIREFLQPVSESTESYLETSLNSWKSTIKGSRPSGTQFKVFGSLQQLPELSHALIPFEPSMEALVGRDMFCVDILTPWPMSEGQWSTVALEIDGPHHFSTNSLGRRHLGTDVARKLCLNSLGIYYVSIPCYEWDVMEDEDEKKAYLTTTLITFSTP